MSMQKDLHLQTCLYIDLQRTILRYQGGLCKDIFCFSNITLLKLIYQKISHSFNFRKRNHFIDQYFYEEN